MASDVAPCAPCAEALERRRPPDRRPSHGQQDKQHGAEPSDGRPQHPCQLALAQGTQLAANTWVSHQHNMAHLQQCDPGTNCCMRGVSSPAAMGVTPCPVFFAGNPRTAAWPTRRPASALCRRAHGKLARQRGAGHFGGLALPRQHPCAGELLAMCIQVLRPIGFLSFNAMVGGDQAFQNSMQRLAVEAQSQNAQPVKESSTGEYSCAELAKHCQCTCTSSPDAVETSWLMAWHDVLWKSTA